MTLLIVGLPGAVIGAVVGAWYGFTLADAIQKTTCTCHSPRRTEKNP